MSHAKSFVEYLKNNEVNEAINVIKQALAERAQEKIAEQRIRIAESFGLTQIKESDDSEEDDSDEDQDEDEDEDEDDRESDKD